MGQNIQGAWLILNMTEAQILEIFREDNIIRHESKIYLERMYIPHFFREVFKTECQNPALQFGDIICRTQEEFSKWEKNLSDGNLPVGARTSAWDFPDESRDLAFAGLG